MDTNSNPLAAFVLIVKRNAARYNLTSQRKLAARLGVSNSEVSAWLQMKRCPSADRWPNLASAGLISMDEMLAIAQAYRRWKRPAVTPAERVARLRQRMERTALQMCRVLERSPDADPLLRENAQAILRLVQS